MGLDGLQGFQRFVYISFFNGQFDRKGGLGVVEIKRFESGYFLVAFGLSLHSADMLGRTLLVLDVSEEYLCI